MDQLSLDYIEIEKSDLFSIDWYLTQYPDVADAGVDPVQHYLSYGAAESRDPGPGFSTSGYLARYPDVSNARINPLLHYLRDGEAEGRITSSYSKPYDTERVYHNLAEYLLHWLHSCLTPNVVCFSKRRGYFPLWPNLTGSELYPHADLSRKYRFS